MEYGVCTYTDRAAWAGIPTGGRWRAHRAGLSIPITCQECNLKYRISKQIILIIAAALLMSACLPDAPGLCDGAGQCPSDSACWRDDDSCADMPGLCADNDGDGYTPASPEADSRGRWARGSQMVNLDAAEPGHERLL